MMTEEIVTHLENLNSQGKINLKNGKRHLLEKKEPWSFLNILEIEVLEISSKAFKIKFPGGISWEDKKEFSEKYQIYEEL